VETLENISKVNDEKDEKYNDEKDSKEIRCKYFNKGYCKMNKNCLFLHMSEKVCENHKHGTKCGNKECSQRHPKNCRYFLRGTCWRSEDCSYLHGYKNKERNTEKIGIEENIDENMNETVDIMETTNMDNHSGDNFEDQNNEIMEECAKGLSRNNISSILVI
jgi:hypothetical protein